VAFLPHARWPGNRLEQTSQSLGIPLRKAIPHGKQKEFWTRFPIDLIIHDNCRPKAIIHDDSLTQFDSS
jgi:hypothetical protein